MSVKRKSQFRSTVHSLLPSELVQKRIYYLRGTKVMIDRDLAELYGVETRALNQAVRRNQERFPEDFMFSLTRREVMSLSQIVISSDIKYAPNVFAFTEQGVAMLSSVLRSPRAIQVNIQIMRIFIKIKEFMMIHKDLERKIEELQSQFKDHDKKIILIFEAIKQLLKEDETSRKKEPIGFHPPRK